MCTAVKANCNIEHFPIEKSFAQSQYNFCSYFHRYAKVQLTVLGLASYLGAVFMPEFVHFVVSRTAKFGSKLTCTRRIMVNNGVGGEVVKYHIRCSNDLN